MSYLAIARKWRPHRFEDLVGQLHVVQTLKNSIVFDRVGHAYLFCGARGVGKTSVARIFAKALRCPNAKDAVPCNQCEECTLIAESRSVDVVEIDGASNNGVEAVRNIRDNVAYGAATGKFKIYIIDEVHMLSVAAFNALLKTLEEPPQHVVFIFATTEMQKIPLTILSRCQRFEFRRLTNLQVIDRLKTILESEALVIEEAGLSTLASHADGSLRDALSLLDQVLSFYSEKREKKESISGREVVEALGVSDASHVVAFWEHILNKDTKALLALIGDTHMSGVDLKYFSEKCLEELRLLYLVTLSKEDKREISADALDISEGHFTKLLEMAEKSDALSLERMSQVLSKAMSQLGWSSLPLFVLEMAAVRMTKLDVIGKLQEALLSKERMPVLEQPKPTPTPAPPRTSAPVQKPSVVTASHNRPITPPAPEPRMQEIQRPVVIPPSGGPEALWRGFVDFVMKKRPLIGTLLTHANYKVEKKGTSTQVHLAFQENSFYEKQAKDSKQDIDTQLKAFLGAEAVIILSTDLVGTNESLEEIRDKEAQNLKKESLDHPAVQQVQSILGAEVVAVQVDI